MNLRECLLTKQVLMDGAMGTYYAGMAPEDKSLPELASLNHPELIQQIHQQYIEAGARLIRTNTFASNTSVIPMSHVEQRQLIVASCEIAKSAIRAAKENGIHETVYIGGSIGPIPMNSSMDSIDIEEEYKRIGDDFLAAGVDAIIFETMDDLNLIQPAITYIRSKSDVFIMTNFLLNKNGYTQSGVSAQRILDEASRIEAIDAVGFNCGIGPGHMYSILEQLKLPANKYISVLPNASYPEQIQNRLVFLDNKNYFRQNMLKIEALGVHLIGGCCGTTPSYIKELASHCGKKPCSAIQVTSAQKKPEESVKRKTNPLLRLFEGGRKVAAVELDPPYDADCTKILDCAKKLKNADIITLADSPMGRSRVDSVLMSIKIAQETGHLVMPHISCRDKNMIAMRSTLLGGYIHGIRNCLLVTGDPVPSVSRVNTTSVFDYNSIQLMNFVKEMNKEHFSEDPIVYGGALNHARGFIERVAERMQKKVDAGAQYFLTQPIYCKEDMERIARLKELVDTKILCGIMPLVSYRNANFIKNEMTGIYVPDEIVNRYSPDMTKEEAELVGAQIANELIAQMSDIADGYYFMLPFNRVSLMDKIKIQ